MSLFNTSTINYRRYTLGSYSGPGNAWVPGGEVQGSPFQLEGTWQPAGGEDLKVLPEGNRIGVIFKLYTSTDLQVDDPVQEIAGDKIISPLDGLLYTVSADASYQNKLIQHHKYICVREKE